MDKREMIEKAFRDMAKHEMIDPYEVAEFAAVVTGQAIVIECEVEHGKTESGFGMTDVLIQERPSLASSYRWVIRSVAGHHGTPGKAIAIILSSESEGEI